MNQDDRHVKLLAIFHYVVGGLTAMFSLFGLIHLVFGLAMILAPEKLEPKGQPPPAFIGWILAAFIVTTGRFLARHKHYPFCLVLAGIECVLMPFGTVLGVFTIMVLMRESVKGAFSPNTPSQESVAPCRILNGAAGPERMRK